MHSILTIIYQWYFFLILFNNSCYTRSRLPTLFEKKMKKLPTHQISLSLSLSLHLWLSLSLSLSLSFSLSLPLSLSRSIHPSFPLFLYISNTSDPSYTYYGTERIFLFLPPSLHLSLSSYILYIYISIVYYDTAPNAIRRWTRRWSAAPSWPYWSSGSPACRSARWTWRRGPAEPRVASESYPSCS